MVKKCSICSERIIEEAGKLLGTMLRVSSLHGKKSLIYVCSDCQKDKKWVEKSKVRNV
jgi:hypothetical protein